MTTTFFHIWILHHHQQNIGSYFTEYMDSQEQSICFIFDQRKEIRVMKLAVNSIDQFINTKRKQLQNIRFLHAQEAQLVKGQQNKTLL